jgi:16S rRNA (cytidine1402-2'-O)-methyltransferase
MTAAPGQIGRLVVCPTPIGNLDDLTPRVLSALRDASVIACEDTRHTRRLLDRYGVSAPLVSLHEHNERARAAELLRRLRAGALVALVSDAGTPLISDPGFVLVQACLQAGVPVEVLPGPSAVTTALVASGLAASRWCFVGFLPRARGELRALLEGCEQTLVAFESPRRLPATLRVLADSDQQRPAAVCRELSKRHEEVRRGSAGELAAYYAADGPGAPVRGEIVLVVGAAAPGARSQAQAARALAELVDAGAKARPAAAAVARLTGVPANELYRQLARTRAGAGGRGGDARGSARGAARARRGSGDGGQ